MTKVSYAGIEILFDRTVTKGFVWELCDKIKAVDPAIKYCILNNTAYVKPHKETKE